jgi:UDP-N-acetylglucosamine 4,6-dehydratase
VPKIPSVRIVDLASAVAPGLPLKVVGIRPGEKIHEIMCPADDSHLALEFDDHYVMRPTITFADRSNHYSPNRLGEEGAPVEPGFEYNSGRNDRFLSTTEIADAIRLVGIE